MNLAATLSLQNSGFLNPLAAGRAALGGFKSALSGLLAPLAALAGAAGGAGLALKAISAAADSEDLVAKLKVLTKDAGTAKSILKELNAFSDVTPFEPEPVQRAGVALIGAKFGATGLRDLLTDIGDLAAVGMGDLSSNLNEVVSAFGRMKSGQFGEAFEMLKRFSISTSELAGKGLKFDASGQFKGSAEEAIAAVRAIITERFGGTMAEMAVTTNGLWSTLKGNVTAVFREVGGPLLDPLKEAISNIGGIIKDWAAPAGEAIGRIVNLIQGAGIGEVLNLTLRAGFGTAINYALAGFKALTEALGAGLAGAATGFMNLLGLVLTPEFWKGLGNSLLSIGALFVGTLQKALAGILNRLGEVPGLGGLKEYGAAASEQGDESFSKAGELGMAGGFNFAKAAFPLIADMAKTGEGMASVFTRAFGNVIDVTGAGEFSDKLAELFNVAPPLNGGLDPEVKDAAGSAGRISAADRKTDADRLAKIGIFVGAAGGPALEHARKTSDNTAKIAGHAGRILEIMPGLALPQPSWA